MQRREGVSYLFYVHHFSGDGSLKDSSATLRVFNVPGLDVLHVPTLAKVRRRIVCPFCGSRGGDKPRASESGSTNQGASKS